MNMNKETHEKWRKHGKKSMNILKKIASPCETIGWLLERRMGDSKGIYVKMSKFTRALLQKNGPPVSSVRLASLAPVCRAGVVLRLARRFPHNQYFVSKSTMTLCTIGIHLCMYDFFLFPGLSTFSFSFSLSFQISDSFPLHFGLLYVILSR